MRDVEAKRVMVLRDRLLGGALALGLGVTVSRLLDGGRRHPPAAGQRAPRGARVRGRLAALPARRRRVSSAAPGRPARPACRSRATCCSRWGSPRPRPAARCGSRLGHTSTEADVDAFLAALPGVVERARAGWRPGGAALMRVARRDVGRGRLGRRRRSHARRRPRGGRGAPGPVALSPHAARDGARGCCTIEDAGDARRAADRLGIPFYVWDLASGSSATSSTTSSPSTPPAAPRTRACAATSGSSSRALLDKAVALGFDAVAPATTRGSSRGRRRRELHRAVDSGEGPVLRARRARPATSSRARCSPWATRSSPRSARRPPSAGFSVADEARQPRHLLHPRRRHRGPG